jgi:hypothetical protein
MTKAQLIKEMKDFPSDMEIRVEFGVDHHAPIERVDEFHQEGEETPKDNYLLLILE